MVVGLTTPVTAVRMLVPVVERELSTDWMPAWSPDGSQIVFASDRTGDFDLYVMDARDGSDLRHIVSGSGDDLFPSWSSDGRFIAFSSSRDNKYLGFTDYDLYIYDVRAGLIKHLGPAHGAGAVDSAPTWSPDGRHLAFSAESPERSTYGVNIAKMRADGTDMTYLSDGAAREDVPSWSPDGLTIAFASAVTGNFDIYLMAPDGSGVRRLTKHPGADFKPSWSPDGLEIAFESRRHGNVDIYIMNADGSGLRRVTSDPADDFMPAWAPDGQELAFVSDRDGDADIYVIHVEGGYLRKLN